VRIPCNEERIWDKHRKRMQTGGHHHLYLLEEVNNLNEYQFFFMRSVFAVADKRYKIEVIDF